ncbi:MAG TPA: type II secretion system protein GspM [Pseudomonas sp.]|uniref:type II secretion system protein GspM n=1 Tax=Pseudomonas sp. TaxID=306 RepID=UPI002B46583B|nr:type II secretion system protein GspM [Pseudomonas sp.]HKS12497.1 type II secretion system protein GspM [Pseudomonas sp.]
MNSALLTRYRKPLAGAVIGLLLAILGLREGVAQWRELAQWKSLAETAAGLPGGPSMSLERLRQSAQARHVQLAGVDARGAVWQLHGQVADARALQQWLQALQGEGVRPLQWTLEQDTAGLRFDVQVQP